jgi:predicted amidohydrolase YtcJ
LLVLVLDVRIKTRKKLPFANKLFTMKYCQRISLLVISILLMDQINVLAQKADIIFFNGKIFTSDKARLYVEALAVKGNEVLAVGNNESIKALSGAGTKEIDLEGRTVIPGFNDAHDHLGFLVPRPQTFITELSSPAGPSKAAVIDSLLRLKKMAAPGQWLNGTIGLIVFRDTTVRRKLLDSLIPDNPVALQIFWGHGMILNSKALAVAHISDTVADPVSGWYERRPGTRYLTGALSEGSQFAVLQDLTFSDPGSLIKELRAHAQEELRFGITTVQDMCATLDGSEARQIFPQAMLPVRTRVIAMPGSTERGRTIADWEMPDKQLTPLTYVSGIKYVLDGEPMQQIALMSKPYPGRLGWYGRLNYPIDTLKQILKEALTSQRQLMIHIAGDSTMTIVLELMKELADAPAWRGKRVRIEHGVGVRAVHIKDIKDMGMVIVHTPQFGMNNAIRTWTDAGIPVAVGPDALINPYLAILTMTTRQTDPKENVTVEQAVIDYTKNAAYAEFAEDKKGTLAAHKLADLAVLSQDIFTIPANQLLRTRSLLTMVDGKIVYDELLHGQTVANKKN